MKKNSFGKTVATIVLSIVSGALSVSAQENPELAPRALPVAGPNEIARFLAGMPVPPDSPLAPLTRNPAWQEHSAYFEREFSKLTVRQLQKLHAWEDIYLPEATQPIPVAFYMFSGPDFLYVDQFFPRASVYVLCGKESMGPPPDPLRIANLSGALGNLENAMKSSLTTTYFITKNMKIDLHEQNLNGVLPILYTFIARADKSINNVTFGSLNGSGTFQESTLGKRGSIPGVRISYTDNQTGRFTNAVLLHYRYFRRRNQIHSGFPEILRAIWRRLEFSQVFIVSDVRGRFRHHPQFHSRTQQQNCAGRRRNPAGLL